MIYLTLNSSVKFYGVTLFLCGRNGKTKQFVDPRYFDCIRVRSRKTKQKKKWGVFTKLFLFFSICNSA